MNARGADGQPLGTVLRLGAVYGSRIKGNYERLTHALARHRFIPIGSGLNRRTLVYDKDVGRAAALAVSHPAAAGRVFNVTDGGYHTLNEIIESICSAVGRKQPRLSLPVGPTRTLTGLIEKGYRLMGIMGTRSRILANSGQALSPRFPGAFGSSPFPQIPGVCRHYDQWARYRRILTDFSG